MAHSIRRAIWSLVGMFVATAVLPAATAMAADDTEKPARLLWICVYSEDEVKAEPARVKTDAGVYVYDPHVFCHRRTEEHQDPIDPTHAAAVTHFLELAGMSLQEMLDQQAGAMLCHDGGVGTISLAQGLPDLAGAKESCSKPVVPSGAGGALGGDEGGGILPDLFGSSAGMPSSDSIKCSASGAANPWADEADGGVKGPRTSDGDIATAFLGSWVTGVAVIWGSSKGAGSAGTLGGGVVAGGAGAAGITAWGTAAANTLGNLMEGRYKDGAESLAKEAAGFAQAAEANAQAAQMAADTTNDPAAQEAADRARAAADAAKKAADAAAAAAKQAASAKTRADAAAAYQAAKKADEEAKKKAEEAGKARQDAQNKNPNGQPQGGASPSSAPTPSTNGTPAGNKAESTCENVRRQVWECEQAGWKTFDCQQLARMFQRCQIDMTVALVDDYGAVCGNATITEEQMTAARDEACGLAVAHPMPGTDPCALTVTGTPEIKGSCDPTVAYGGCPEQEPVVIEGDDTICFPTPPSVPPMPCVDPTPGGGPPIGGLLIDRTGGVFVVGSGGVIALGQGYPPRWR